MGFLFCVKNIHAHWELVKNEALNNLMCVVRSTHSKVLCFFNAKTLNQIDMCRV